MKAIVIDGPELLRITELPNRDPAPDEITIEVDLVGICATDQHILSGHFPTASYPITPGHEITGTVTRIGSEVTDIEPGQRVVIDPGVPCRTCRLCRDGRPNLCENREAYGITLAGGAAEYLTLPASNCHPVGPTTLAPAAVLAEPLACVLHAFDLIRDPAGHDVLIYGAGTIGLLAIQVARYRGAAGVSVIDLNPERVTQASRVGADNAATSASGLEPDKRWDLVVDATGFPAAIADGLSRVSRGGTFLQVGVASPESIVEVAPYSLFAGELTIVGSLTTRFSFPRAIALLDDGRIDASLITAPPVPLTGYADAIATAGTSVTPKAVVSPRMPARGSS